MVDESKPVSITSNIIDRFKLRHPSIVQLLPQDFFLPIANVTVAWGFFEAAFEQALAAMTMSNGIPDDDWRGFSFRRRRGLFDELLDATFPADPSVVALGRAVVRDSEPLYAKRNLVVHGRMAMEISVDNGAQIVRLQCVGRFKRKELRDAFTADQLDDLYYQIAHLHGRLAVMMDGNLGPPVTSPGTQTLQAFLTTNRQTDPTASTPPSPPQPSGG